jgi:hypothetical protein
MSVVASSCSALRVLLRDLDVLQAFIKSFKLGSDMIRSVFLKEPWQHSEWNKTEDRDTIKEAIDVTQARDNNSPAVRLPVLV